MILKEINVIYLFVTIFQLSTASSTHPTEEKEISTTVY